MTRQDLKVISISLFVSIVVSLLALAYLFQKTYERPKLNETINTCDEVSIDTIRANAVKDTIIHFQALLEKQQRVLRQKDSVNLNQIKTIQSLRKNKDSINNKLVYYREKFNSLRYQMSTE